ncbi:CASP-like protein 1E1 isoform X1 [Rhodamnia argentea]|uniref:CASP-like protein n=1 Tax=Rhodamnia argentea TaxID=178133 RepID=A0A8B8QZ57_9MYRT|nr:CASP-like protein 1E1 isoform X1 [Rhodamnia argentea]
MESQSKSSMDRAAAPGDAKVVGHPPKAFRRPDLLLRTLALALTLAAAIVVGVDKESKIVPVAISQSLTLHVRATAKWQYMSAFVVYMLLYISHSISASAFATLMMSFILRNAVFRYFLVSNAVACSYAAASLMYIAFAGAARSAKADLAISVLDIVVMGLLLSASGASAAIGVIAQRGNSHVQWNEVCHVFGGYCHQMTSAFALCLLGSFAFLLLAVLNVMDLHKKATQR